MIINFVQVIIVDSTEEKPIRMSSISNSENIFTNDVLDIKDTIQNKVAPMMVVNIAHKDIYFTMSKSPSFYKIIA